MISIVFMIEVAGLTLKSRSASSIVVTFDKLSEDKGRLTYKVDVSGYAANNAKKKCSVTSCTVTGLSSGRAYSLSVTACFKSDTGVCGDASPKLLIYTLPKGYC